MTKEQQIRTEAIKKAKLKIKDIIIIEVKGNKVSFKVPAFDGCYNISKGGGNMSLNQADKEWIKEAIVTGVAEGIKPLSDKIDAVKAELKDDIQAVDAKVDKLSGRIDNLIKKNDLKE